MQKSNSSKSLVKVQNENIYTGKSLVFTSKYYRETIIPFVTTDQKWPTISRKLTINLGKVIYECVIYKRLSSTSHIKVIYENFDMWRHLAASPKCSPIGKLQVALRSSYEISVTLFNYIIVFGSKILIVGTYLLLKSTDHIWC